MTALTHRPAAPQMQLSAFWRVGAVLAVLCLLVLAYGMAGQASRERVQTAKASMSRTVPTIVLPRVEVVTRREAAGRSI